MCPRWAARVFTDVKVGPSPAWLKARIAAAGMRPISNVVDITNYVMLAIGEPTHAFDLDKVAGREIIVRRATAGEPVTTLDGQARTLDTETLVIADAEKPSAVAGLMGSEWSEVTAGTTTVLMECANFDGPTTQASSLRLGLRTEGSSRWEKGLDPYLPAQALALASQLMVELAGAKLVPGMIDLHGELPEPPVVPLRRERLEGLIGVAYADAEVDRVLARLGYEWQGTGWRVPTWRAADTTREVDLIEEVARVAGLERVPVAMPGGAPGGGRLNAEERLRRTVVDVLRGAGLSEAATLTLWDTGVPDRLRLAPDDPRRALVELQNPMSADWAAMRTLVFPRAPALGARATWPCRRRGWRSSRSGTCSCAAAGELPDQPARVAGVLAGEGAGFFEVKGVVEAAGRGRRASSRRRSGRRRSRSCTPAGRRAVADGFVGELHPLVAEAFGLGRRGRVRARPRRSARAAAGGGALPRRDQLPAAAPGHRRGCGRGRARGPRCRGRAGRRRAGAGRRGGVRRLPRGAGGGGAQEPRPASGVPGGRSHPHRRRGRRDPGARGRRASGAVGGELRA